MEFGPIIQSASKWLLTDGLKILLILILMFVFIKLAHVFTDRLFKRYKRDKQQRDQEFRKRTETLSSVAASILKVCILIVAVITIMGQLDIPIGPVLASAGIVGVALGFGAQHIVKDVISGFFILLDDQIRVGDVVQIAGEGGLVESINLRMVILRDLAGNVHYVRNGEIGVVTNMTKEYSRYVFDIGVAYREDVDEVIEVIKLVDENLRNDPEYKDDILEPIEILGLDQFADSAIVIKARTKTRPIRQWAVGREFNRRLKRTFDEKDIEIPFPHITLYMGQDKQGQSPPVPVNMKQN
jgi:small conductance mechanosensitive channel